MRMIADNIPAAIPVAVPRLIVAHVRPMASGLAAEAILRAIFHGSMANGTATIPVNMQSRYIQTICIDREDGCR